MHDQQNIQNKRLLLKGIWHTPDIRLYDAFL
jgi:hypothetical protein